MPGVIADAVKARKPTKNEQRRAKKKQQKLEAATAEPSDQNGSKEAAHVDNDTSSVALPVKAAANEPVQDVPAVEIAELSLNDPLYRQYSSMLARFQGANNQDVEDQVDKEDLAVKQPDKPEVFYEEDVDMLSEHESEAPRKKTMSKKARKKANKLSIAELKAIARKPELVDWTDPSASDPKLLVSIKSARNVIPVPSHWSLKREWLSSKRGIEKPAYHLPGFLQETGIVEMRAAAHEKQEQATLKQKQRERVQGKVNSITIDYNKLYEAFFRRQTKPTMTHYGEVYYEGKEFETNMRHLVPGQMSDPLREALNMAEGTPPPWILAQQEVGMPPSYPALRIPGLNAPPPPGGQWGHHVGGWGKPPTNADGTPKYGGDLFGMDDTKMDQVRQEQEQEAQIVNPPLMTMWGELQPHVEPESDDEQEEEEDEEEGGAEEENGTQTVIENYGGTETPGINTTLAKETSGEFNLKKQHHGTESETSAQPRSAGQVLNQRAIRNQGFFGGEHTYDLSGVRGQSSEAPMLGDDRGGRKRKVGEMDMSMDVETIEAGGQMSQEQLRKQYEAQRAAQGGGTWKEGGAQEDFSGMVAEDSAKRQKREKEREKERKGRK